MRFKGIGFVEAFIILLHKVQMSGVVEWWCDDGFIKLAEFFCGKCRQTEETEFCCVNGLLEC